MKSAILEHPVEVPFEAVVDEIERFNLSGQNPYGPNVAVKSHAPLTLLLEGPGLDVEFPFYLEDRPEEVRAWLTGNPKFQTRHAVIYPMTRAMIARQWHRVYAFDVERQLVTGVGLLVTMQKDPELFLRNPDASAWPWVYSGTGRLAIPPDHNKGVANKTMPKNPEVALQRFAGVRILRTGLGGFRSAAVGSCLKGCWYSGIVCAARPSSKWYCYLKYEDAFFFALCGGRPETRERGSGFSAGQ